MVSLAEASPRFRGRFARPDHQILEHGKRKPPLVGSDRVLSVLSALEPLRPRDPLLSRLREQPALHLEVSADEEDCRPPRAHQPRPPPVPESRRHHSGERSRRRDPPLLESLPKQRPAAFNEAAAASRECHPRERGSRVREDGLRRRGDD